MQALCRNKNSDHTDKNKQLEFKSIKQDQKSQFME